MRVKLFFFALPTSNTQTVIANTVCPTFYANSVQFHSHTFIQVSWGFFVVVAKCIKQNRTEQNILYGIGIHSIVLCFFFLIHRFAIVFVLYSFSFCCFLSARKRRKNKWYILKANKRTNQGMNKRMNNNCCQSILSPTCAKENILYATHTYYYRAKQMMYAVIMCITPVCGYVFPVCVYWHSLICEPVHSLANSRLCGIPPNAIKRM